MSSNFVYFAVIVLNLLSCSFAIPAAENETSNSETSAKSTSESKREKEKFAAPLSEQDSARTHNSWRPGSFLAGHGSRILPFQQPYGQHQYGQQYSQPTHLPMNRLPILQHLPIPQLPMLKPILSHFRPGSMPMSPAKPIMAPFKPTVPAFSPPVYSPPVMSRPPSPVVSKPTFVVSQQVIHKPVVTEKIEIIRRPVISEVVEVVHKPIISEVQQVLKHPTYVQHIVKKPEVHAIKNEVQGSPLHLPSQHYELHDEPQHIQPVTTEVVQIPHQQVPTHGSVGFGSSYGIGSGYRPSYSGYKPSYGVGSSLSGGTPTYGIGSGMVGLGSSHGFGSGSGIGSGMVGLGSSHGFGSGYGMGSGMVGLGSSQGFGSGYGPSYGAGSVYGSDYGTSSGYGDEYGGVEQSWVVPATGCKSEECRPITSEDAIYPTYDDLQSMNSPYLLYAPPSRDLYGKNNGEELYEQGVPLAPGYYYVNPQVTLDEQLAANEQHASKVDDFLTQPAAKPILDALRQKFLEIYANGQVDDEKLTTQSKGRSSNDDVKTDTEEVKTKPVTESSNEENVKEVMDVIRSSNNATLKKLEAQIRDRQNELENSVTRLADVPSSDPTPKTNQA